MAPSPVKENSLLNISEAAKILNVSKVTVRRWTDDGKLPCTRVGSRQERYFDEADLRKLLPATGARNKFISNKLNQSGTHRCILCDHTERGWQAIVDEINGYLSRDAHVTFIGDSARKKRLAKALQSSPQRLKSLIKKGQLRQLSVKESYLVSGTFSGRRAAAFVESTILDARSRGFDYTLFVGWSDWLAEIPASDFNALSFEVFEYERELNEMIARYPLSTVLCPYSSSEIPASTLFELATHHPQVQFRSPDIYARSSSSDAT